MNKKLDRFLTHAEKSAVDYLERMKENELPMQRAFLACGNHRIDTTETLQGIVRELSEVGFQIFAQRLQALGLAECHVRKLFVGSADFLRFSAHAPAHLGGTCWGGYEDDGKTPRRYSDIPAESSASHALLHAARIEELRPLLKSAKAELAKTQNASMPTGLPA